MAEREIPLDALQAAGFVALKQQVDHTRQIANQAEQQLNAAIEEQLTKAGVRKPTRGRVGLGGTEKLVLIVVDEDDPASVALGPDDPAFTPADDVTSGGAP